jgi:hypothetical protein
MTDMYVSTPDLLRTDKHAKVVRQSPNLVSILPYKPISVSNNVISWVFQTPSFSSLMSEKLCLSFRNIKANFAFAGTPTGNTPFAQLGGLSLRSFPVERFIQTLQVVCGSTSVNFPVSDIMEGIMLASYDMNEFASTAGSFERPLEQVGSAINSVVGTAGGASWATTATANMLCAQTSSATGSFIVSGVPGGVPKGASLNIEAITCSNATAFANGQFLANQAITASTPVQVQFSMVGYLKANIFSWLAEKCGQSLTSLSQIQIIATLNPVKSIFNYVEPQYVPGVTTEGDLALQSVELDPNSFVSSQITLSVRYLTVPPNYTFHDVVRAYYTVDRYITTYGSPSGAQPIAAQTTISALVNSTTTISSNSFTLSVVPRYLAIFVKPARNYFYSSLNSLQVSNFYLPITNVQLTIGNRTSQLASAPSEHLYSLSVESGLKMPYSQWRGYGGVLPSSAVINTPVVGTSANEAINMTASNALQFEPYSGGILLLDLSTCLGVDSELNIARNVPINCQVNVQCINPSGLVINQAEMFILSIYNSYLNIDHLNGNSVVVAGGLSSAEAMEVATMDINQIDNVETPKYAGGFSFSDIVSGVKKVLPAVKNVAKTVASGLENMGYGVTGAGMAEGKKLGAMMKKMKALAM